jgi:hypothetical protein
MLQIESAALHDDQRELHLAIDVHNPTARTLQVCTGVRTIHYDAGSRALTVELAPTAPGAAAPSTVSLLPQIVAIAAHHRHRLDVPLPRILARPAPEQALARPAGAGPVAIEQLPVHRATSVTVSIACGEQAPTTDPSTWPRHLVSFRFARTGEAGLT